MTRLESLVESVRRELAPEPRTAVFEIRVEARDAGFAFTGVTTEAAAMAALLARAAAIAHSAPISDEVVRLPDPTLVGGGWGVIRSAVAPVLAAPDIRASQVSQCVLGARVQLLLAAGRWLRIRCEDGYLGWMNRGYLVQGSADWARDWETHAGGAAAVSLGAWLVEDSGAPVLQLPRGARVAMRMDGRILLPGGRAAVLQRGELVPDRDLPARFPPDGDAIARSAKEWTGAPYLWGGVTPAGVDCSGFVQAVLRLHGVRIPRDAELQLAAGEEIETGSGFSDLRSGDLLFFTEVPGHITHVALSMGGPDIIHSALSNGGVATNRLTGEGEIEPELRRMFVTARRVL